MPSSHYSGLWKNIPRCLPQIQMGLAGHLLSYAANANIAGHFASPDGPFNNSNTFSPIKIGNLKAPSRQVYATDFATTGPTATFLYCGQELTGATHCQRLMQSHGGSANLLCVDGHVSTVRPRLTDSSWANEFRWYSTRGGLRGGCESVCAIVRGGCVNLLKNK